MTTMLFHQLPSLLSAMLLRGGENVFVNIHKKEGAIVGEYGTCSRHLSV
jgi:hypothetical protein